MGIKNVLNHKFYSHDHQEELTVRKYLVLLSREVWEQEDRFSGKRPFGNSGWQFEVYAGLVRGGFIEGEFDDDGLYLDDVDTEAGDKLIMQCYAAMLEGST